MEFFKGMEIVFEDVLTVKFRNHVLTTLLIEFYGKTKFNQFMPQIR